MFQVLKTSKAYLYLNYLKLIKIMDIDYGQASQLTFLDTDDINDMVKSQLTQQSNGFGSQIDEKINSDYKSREDLVC